MPCFWDTNDYCVIWFKASLASHLYIQLVNHNCLMHNADRFHFNNKSLTERPYFSSARLALAVLLPRLAPLSTLLEL